MKLDHLILAIALSVAFGLIINGIDAREQRKKSSPIVYVGAGHVR